MILSNYDLYDIHHLLVRIRTRPEAPEFPKAIRIVSELIRKSGETDAGDMNLVRRALDEAGLCESEDLRGLSVMNFYTYGICFVKERARYVVLFNLLSELSDCLEEGDARRIADCVDALHNVPVILADERGRIKKRILREIAPYAKQYNSLVLESLKMQRF